MATETHGEHGAGEHGAGEHAPAGHPPRGFVQTFLIPLSIPILGFIAAAIVIFCISQILLAVPGKASTPIAFFIALGLLFTGAFVATSRTISRQMMAGIVGVAVVLLVAFGAVGGIYRLNNPEKPEAAGPQVAAVAPGASLQPGPGQEVTTDNKFSITSFTIEAGTPASLTVTNNGQAIHNWEVIDANGQPLKDANGNQITSGLLQPGQSATVKFTIATPGTYNFNCAVHPTEMKGTLTVTPPGANPAAGGQSAITETASDNKFSQTSLTIPHGTPITVTLNNTGQAIHNWEVIDANGQPIKDANGTQITTGLVQPGQSGKVTFTIANPGTYNFNCAVHPTEMKGTLTVK